MQVRRNGASRVVNRSRSSCSKREQASSETSPLIAQHFDTPVPVPCLLAADAGRSEGGRLYWYSTRTPYLCQYAGGTQVGNMARKNTESSVAVDASNAPGVIAISCAGRSIRRRGFGAKGDRLLVCHQFSTGWNARPSRQVSLPSAALYPASPYPK